MNVDVAISKKWSYSQETNLVSHLISCIFEIFYMNKIDEVSLKMLTIARDVDIPIRWYNVWNI